METQNTNIPVTSVNKLVDSLTTLYLHMIRSGTPLKYIPTPFLWGAPGVGKSDAIRQLAKRISKATGKRVNVTDVRLLLFSPADLRGIPVADKERLFTNWLRPRIFNMDGSPDCINILFLDELSAAPQSVQAAAYQICLDRCVGEHALPDNCIVIGAGNRTTDRSVSYNMPKALCNRLMHYLVEPSYTEWKKWALDNAVDDRIIGYLGFDNSMLCIEPERSDNAYPTPRSWNFVSRMIGGVDKLEDVHMLISACIGVDTALSFESWCKIYHDLPKVEDIFAGKCRTYPHTHDALYALTASLATALYRISDTVTDMQIDAVCAYALNFPPDFAVSFFGDLHRNDKLKLHLMNNRLFNAWLHKN